MHTNEASGLSLPYNMLTNNQNYKEKYNIQQEFQESTYSALIELATSITNRYLTSDFNSLSMAVFT
ncbi:hypothetical protein Hanom_Chr14g01291111 [Helianthus anomalus]